MKRLVLGSTVMLAAAAWAAACGSTSPAGSGGHGGGGTSGPPPIVTDGYVSVIAVAADGTTYIGGTFTRVGPSTGHGVPIDATTVCFANSPFVHVNA